MIGIFSSFKDKDYIVTDKVVDAFKKANMSFCVEISTKKDYEGIKKFSMSEMIKLIDVLVYVGGDGTILSQVNLLSNYNVPIVGVNIGRVGFLSEIETNEINLLVSSLIKKDYLIEERSLLKFDDGNISKYALNDISFTKDMTVNNNIVSLDVNVDHSLLGQFVGDGIIISTPTGSTAYNFAAGGPVVSPNLKGYVFTPVCAHSYRSMPIVFDSNSSLSIKLSDGYDKANISIDGISVKPLDVNDKVRISMSNRQIKFIKIKKDSFYNKLLNKLKV